MVIELPLLGASPEDLNPVDVDLAIGKATAAVDPHMSEAASHQAIATAELVGLDQAAVLDLSD